MSSADLSRQTREARTIRDAIDALTDISLGDPFDMAHLHETSLNAYAALDALAARVYALQEALARALWQIDHPDEDVSEWDDDGLLADVYERYAVLASAVPADGENS